MGYKINGLRLWHKICVLLYTILCIDFIILFATLLTKESYQKFEINKKELHLCLYIILLVVIIILLFSRIKFYRKNIDVKKILHKNVIYIIFNIILIIIFLSGLNLIRFVDDDWKTQKIIGINKYSKNKFIEFQMRDFENVFIQHIRTVEILYITKYLIITKEIIEEQDIKNINEWEKLE
jgi:hypothetical protein